MMASNRTADERSQSLIVAALANIEGLSTSSKGVGNRVIFTSRTSTKTQSIYAAKRPLTISPARLAMKVDRDGHAAVFDHQQERPRKKPVHHRAHHSSGTRYREQNSDRKIIHGLRRLASSLERRLDDCREPLPENVYGLIEDVRQLVKRAENKALTTAFYGQPPRI